MQVGSLVRDPHVMEQLSQCATAIEAVHKGPGTVATGPMCHNQSQLQKEAPRKVPELKAQVMLPWFAILSAYCHTYIMGE